MKRLHLLAHVILSPIRRFGGIVVSVLATGSKGSEFNPGQGDGFLRAIKDTERLILEGN
jgi:hypothetical protein